MMDSRKYKEQLENVLSFYMLDIEQMKRAIAVLMGSVVEDAYEDGFFDGYFDCYTETKR